MRPEDLMATELRCEILRRCAAVALHNCHLEQRGDLLLDATVYELTQKIAAHKLDTVEHHERVPNDWWQHLKHRWFPKWALRRWPVLFRDIHFQVRVVAAFPHGRIQIDGARKGLQFYDLHEELIYPKDLGKPDLGVVEGP